MGRAGIQKFFHVKNHSLPGVGGNVEDLGVHSNGVLRAGLHAETAVDAFAEIDDETFGTFFNVWVGVSLGLNVNAPGRADGLTHHAGHAPRGTVHALREAVPGAGARRKRPLLLGPLESHGRTDRLRESKLVKDMNREVPEEVARGHPEP